MQITPGEIDRIEEVGELDGKPVKMVRTKGGFWIAIAKRKGKHSEEALAAGSHPAIVKYNLEKQFADYQPHMMKSEGFVDPIVAKHSHFLSDELRKSGHDIYSIQTGNAVEFQITKQNATVGKINGNLEKDHLLIDSIAIPQEFSKAMAGASVEKAVACQVGLKLRK